MGILVTIIVGAVIGWLASIIGKTNDQMGCLWNVVVGVVGAALGHWLARFIFKDVSFTEFSLGGFLVSLGGALLLVLILRGVGVLRRDS